MVKTAIEVDVPAYVRGLGSAMREVGATRVVMSAGPVREMHLGPVGGVLESTDLVQATEDAERRAEAILYASAGG